MLYMSYVNFLKHLDGAISDVFSKIVQIFERGLDQNLSGLKLKERQSLAKFYLDFM